MALELRVGMTKHVHLFKTRELLLIMFVMQTEKAITCFEMCGFDGEAFAAKDDARLFMTKSLMK